jgi:hypothetical protein
MADTDPETRLTTRPKTGKTPNGRQNTVCRTSYKGGTRWGSHEEKAKLPEVKTIKGTCGVSGFTCYEHM